MKKMPLATALALLITGCAQQTPVQNKPAAVAPKETITHHFFVSGIGPNFIPCSQNLAAQKMLLKQKPKQTFVNGLLGFITGHFILPLEAQCVLLTIITPGCPSWATLSALLINILLGSFQLFFA